MYRRPRGSASPWAHQWAPSLLPAFKLQPSRPLYLSQGDGLTTPTPLHFSTPHLHALPIDQATSPFKCEDSPETPQPLPRSLPWLSGDEHTSEAWPTNSRYIRKHTAQNKHRHSQREKITHSLLSDCMLLRGQGNQLYAKTNESFQTIRCF